MRWAVWQVNFRVGWMKQNDVVFLWIIWSHMLCHTGTADVGVTRAAVNFRWGFLPFYFWADVTPEDILCPILEIRICFEIKELNILNCKCLLKIDWREREKEKERENPLVFLFLQRTIRYRYMYHGRIQQTKCKIRMYIFCSIF